MRPRAVTSLVGPLAALGARIVDTALGLPPRTSTYTVQRDLPVSLPDGVALLGDLYRPDDAEGALPVVLIRLPYGRAGSVAQACVGPLARRGFQVFIQSTRGTFGSGGRFEPFTTEREDGVATVGWLRAQPWCDGRVAMTGASYFGHTQWAIAPYVDPPLIAVSPHTTAARIMAGFHHGDVPALHTALSWTMQVARQEANRLPPLGPRPRLEARIRRAFRHLPLQAADSATTGVPLAFWRDFTAHAEPGDRFWSVSDHSAADLSRVPPVSMVTGWWDLFVAAQMTDYRRLRDAGVPARITVGPWLHGEPAEFKEMMRTDLVWLQHHLHGGPAPTGAPVRLYVINADTWIESDTWPPAASRPVVHHLRAGGGLSEQAEAAAPGPSRFTYDPADPTPSVGGPLLKPPGKQADNRELEERADVLVFTGPPTATDVDIVGTATALVHVRTELEYADVFVRVCDVDPAGVSRNVVDGVRRLDPRTVPGSDVTVGDDGVLAVEVELFPTAYRLRTGHRLRVQVSGGAFPRFARNLGTSEPFGTATSLRSCRFEVFHDAERPSHLRLPVLA